MGNKNDENSKRIDTDTMPKTAVAREMSIERHSSMSPITGNPWRLAAPPTSSSSPRPSIRRTGSTPTSRPQSSSSQAAQTAGSAARPITYKFITAPTQPPPTPPSSATSLTGFDLPSHGHSTSFTSRTPTAGTTEPNPLTEQQALLSLLKPTRQSLNLVADVSTQLGIPLPYILHRLEIQGPGLYEARGESCTHFVALPQGGGEVGGVLVPLHDLYLATAIPSFSAHLRPVGTYPVSTTFASLPTPATRPVLALDGFPPSWREQFEVLLRWAYHKDPEGLYGELRGREEGWMREFVMCAGWCGAGVDGRLEGVVRYVMKWE
ncbi:hypothetical protein SAICODRAFT_18586 [Saitoella complicata NRRL Y-17804]|uniref:Uncharacterized protein n=1 Tax=Saitoella complicata (strain BCRC 22490 / CBS 7301 / JCM 7358 / NBRC 10748 / NRRL Y-17804) TaxID=698492 RepID=A0A0E9NH38_SAICN|nr:uncharacterized protein SAICODRAFT_18586 [Saitoella complicata NRRL Y-17804]ODQ53546.1 hypothetical protein SAICODRAFT_18586 [Saitoella complicata NRRL Y-17804]GAO48725.1 hypothetical protein G7K_2895-t1 [Saitoella complicata NRRL Y-17804]